MDETYAEYRFSTQDHQLWAVRVFLPPHHCLCALPLFCANLRGIILDGANLGGANLRGANLYGDEITGVANEQELEERAEFLAGTTMPDGTEHP